MSRQSATVIAAVAASAVALLGGFFALQRAPGPAQKAAAPSLPTSSVTPTTREPPPAPVGTTSGAARASASAALDPALRDERTLMTTLRELRSSDPPRTLSLARQGNQRFEGSPDAAERSWFVVKSLTDLGRHDEARVAGRALLERHRGTRFAEDVYRHLFVNPGTHPSERGYGKELESDP